mgnify:CR=1 FL=1
MDPMLVFAMIFCYFDPFSFDTAPIFATSAKFWKNPLYKTSAYIFKWPSI